MKKQSNAFMVGSLVSIAVIAGATGYVFGYNAPRPKVIEQATTFLQPTQPPESFVPTDEEIQAFIAENSTSSEPNKGWEKYTDPKGNFSFYYPEEYSLSEEKDGPHTVISIRNYSEVRQPQPTDRVIWFKYMTGTAPASFPYSNGSTGNYTQTLVKINAYEGIRGYTTSPFGYIEKLYLNRLDYNRYMDIEILGDPNSAYRILTTFRFEE